MVPTKKQNLFLLSKAKAVRKKIIKMTTLAQSAHIGGSLSCVEVLVALYFSIMKINPKKADWDKRDRLLFSKAHDAKALYAVLAEKKFFNSSLLKEYEVDGKRIAGHSVKGSLPGIEISAGSLGHGLPIGTGMAFAGKLNKKKYRVFVVISDGECDEGTTWESALFAGFHKLDNLICIIDYNKLQAFGYTKDILDLEPLKKKWEAFRWSVEEVDGHDLNQIIKKLSTIPFKKNKPSLLIAHTIKGLGGVPQHVGKISSQYIPPNKIESESLIKNLSV